MNDMSSEQTDSQLVSFLLSSSCKTDQMCAVALLRAYNLAKLAAGSGELVWLNVNTHSFYVQCSHQAFPWWSAFHGLTCTVSCAELLTVKEENFIGNLIS